MVDRPRLYELWRAEHGKSQRIAGLTRLEDALREIRTRVAEGDEGAFAIRHPDGRWQHFRRPRRKLSSHLRVDFEGPGDTRPESASARRPGASPLGPVRETPLMGTSSPTLPPPHQRAAKTPAPTPERVRTQSGAQLRPDAGSAPEEHIGFRAPKKAGHDDKL